jgi:hypothetical protein
MTIVYKQRDGSRELLSEQANVMSEQQEYILANSAAELERLRLQARVWEPEVKTSLDEVGIWLGWPTSTP